jgi:phosphatidylserine/phosphatidylglycerophosphate/cardiolipin synthase-like enzyme
MRRRSPAQVLLLEPLPQDPQIQVYFNHSEASAYTEPYRQQYRLGDDLEQVVVQEIASAQRSIDVAMHELNLPRVAVALKQKHDAGVQVRVVVENTYRRPLSQLTPQEVKQLDSRQRQKYQNFVQLVDQNHNGQLEPSEIAARDAMVILQSVPLRDDTADGSKGSDLMHHKFLVIDGHTVITGSANLTWSDIHGDFSSLESQGNANHLLKIESPALARLYSQEFNLMWGNPSRFGIRKPYRPAQTIKLGANSQITVQFSPTSKQRAWQQSVNGLIGRTLAQAKQSVDLALFVFSDQQLSDILAADHNRGVQVRALIEPSFAYRDYSEALDMLGVRLANPRCRYEANNHPWQQGIATVGVPQLPPGDLLHHKFGVIDGHLVITGSQNWSDAANMSNDENLLVIDNPTVAAHFQREFTRLYRNASLGLPASLKAKLQQQQKRCVFQR